MDEQQLAELELHLACGLDVPTALSAVEQQPSEAPRVKDAQPSARGAWLVGLLIGMIAALAASLFLGR